MGLLCLLIPYEYMLVGTYSIHWVMVSLNQGDSSIPNCDQVFRLWNDDYCPASDVVDGQLISESSTSCEVR